MSKPYSITFTEFAKVQAVASCSLAAVEAQARAEIDAEILWRGVPDCEIDLPEWGFHIFETPEGMEFLINFYGPDLAEIADWHRGIGSRI